MIYLFSRHLIRSTMYKLNLSEIRINVPVNITSIPLSKLKQPPGIVW